MWRNYNDNTEPETEEFNTETMIAINKASIDFLNTRNYGNKEP